MSSQSLLERLSHACHTLHSPLLRVINASAADQRPHEHVVSLGGKERQRAAETRDEQSITRCRQLLLPLTRDSREDHLSRISSSIGARPSTDSRTHIISSQASSLHLSHCFKRDSRSKRKSKSAFSVNFPSVTAFAACVCVRGCDSATDLLRFFNPLSVLFP